MSIVEENHPAPKIVVTSVKTCKRCPEGECVVREVYGEYLKKYDITCNCQKVI